MSSSEKPKTAAEQRARAHAEISRAARELAKTALDAIDEVLGYDPANDPHTRRMESLRNYEKVLSEAIERGEVTHEEANQAFGAYRNWIETGESGLEVLSLPYIDGQPVRDRDDPLAEPFIFVADPNQLTFID
jgi:hypothetical protein